MFMQIKHQGLLYRAFYYLERRLKEIFFDCHMCGQCIVRSTGLVCPMRCPKQMRNGPCGGSMNGICEVYPDRRCVWTQIQQRAGRWAWMRRKQAAVQPALDWSLFGTSAWLNVWPERKTDPAGHALTPTPPALGNRWTEPLREPGDTGD